MGPLFNRFAESFSSTWRLLSDTTNFLSRIKLLDQYESELRTWRDRLSRYRKNPQGARAIREDIVALRKHLRSQGYDLRLGSKDIVIEGWRHDDAMAEGFRRIVLGAAEGDVYFVAGDANHNDLAEALESQCQARRSCKPFSVHCLWYRWRADVLVLSGAASESAEQFEGFRRYFEANKDLLLRKLSRL
jgi:hypothetical protein